MSIFSQGFQLRNALEQGHTLPAFHPICNLKNGEPMAYEVLARMRINGLVIQAKDFITVAEELGLTRYVDLHIIGQALKLTPLEYALFLNVDITSFNDKDFARGMLRNESDRKIVTHIHELATSFGMQTIAESVEDAATERVLQEIGIDTAQGLFY